MMIVQVLAPTSVANAFRTAGDLADFDGTARVRWRSELVSVRGQVSPASGLASASFESALRQAIAIWNEVPCDGGVHLGLEGWQTDGATRGDGEVTIEWVEDWLARGYDPSKPATTDILYERDEAGRWWIVDADILLNVETAAWNPSEEGALDLSVALSHELGHVLGLLHPCEFGEPGVPDCSIGEDYSDALLHPRYQGHPGTGVGEDDRRAVCFLYSPDDCQVLACPRGYSCTATGCDRDEVSDACASESASDLCLGEVGDPCAFDEECRTSVCADGGYCTSLCPDGTCSAGFSCSRSEGICVPAAGVYGDSCRGGDGCASKLCIAYEQAGTCTRTCEASGPCPAAHRCADVDGDSVCVPPAPTRGCAVGIHGTPNGRPAWPHLAYLTLLIGARRRFRTQSKERR